MHLLFQSAKWLTQKSFLLIVRFKRSKTNLASTVIWSYARTNWTTGLAGLIFKAQSSAWPNFRIFESYFVCLIYIYISVNFLFGLLTQENKREWCSKWNIFLRLLLECKHLYVTARMDRCQKPKTRLEILSIVWANEKLLTPSVVLVHQSI
jgi:hypothetical protein